MYNIHKDRPLKITWKIYKERNYTEAFGDCALRVFVCTPTNRYPIEPTLSDNPICVEIPSEMKTEVGAYNLQAIWIKNHRRDEVYAYDGRRIEANICRTEAIGAFCIVDSANEESPEFAGTDLGRMLTINLKTVRQTYGYDGLDAYDIAVFRGETADMAQWLKAYTGKLKQIQDAAIKAEQATARADEAAKKANEATDNYESALSAVLQEVELSSNLRTQLETAEAERVDAESARKVQEALRDAHEEQRSENFARLATQTEEAIQNAKEASQQATASATKVNEAIAKADSATTKAEEAGERANDSAERAESIYKLWAVNNNAHVDGIADGQRDSANMSMCKTTMRKLGFSGRCVINKIHVYQTTPYGSFTDYSGLRWCHVLRIVNGVVTPLYVSKSAVYISTGTENVACDDWEMVALTDATLSPDETIYVAFSTSSSYAVVAQTRLRVRTGEGEGFVVTDPTMVGSGENYRPILAVECTQRNDDYDKTEVDALVKAEAETRQNQVTELAQSISAINVDLTGKQNQIDSLESGKASKTEVSAVKTTADKALKIAKGANQAVSFDTYEEMFMFLDQGASAWETKYGAEAKTGQNIYIGTLSVPDVWISGIGGGLGYSYTSDEQTAKDLVSETGIVTAWCTLRALETQKVDLSEVQDKLTSDVKATASVGKVQSGSVFPEGTAVRDIVVAMLSFETPTFASLSVSDGTTTYSASKNIFCSGTPVSFKTINHSETNVDSIKGRQIKLNINGTEITKGASSSVASVARTDTFDVSKNKATYRITASGTNTLNAPMTSRSIVITAYMPVYTYVCDTHDEVAITGALVGAEAKQDMYVGASEIVEQHTFKAGGCWCVAVPSHLKLDVIGTEAAVEFNSGDTEAPTYTAKRSVNGVADVDYTIYAWTCDVARTDLSVKIKLK